MAARRRPRGDGSGGLVELHGGDVEPGGGQGHGVGADPAAQIGHAAHAGLDVPAGVDGGDAQPGGLLEAVLGEEHVLCELAELGGRGGAQPGLGHGRGDQLGSEPLGAQPRDLLQGLVLPVGTQRVEQVHALGGEQRGQGIGVSAGGRGLFHVLDPSP